jgi:hypothetical protein
MLVAPLQIRGREEIISIHDDIGLIRFVIPDLIRNPVFFWTPAFMGMTGSGITNVAGYKKNCFKAVGPP